MDRFQLNDFNDREREYNETQDAIEEAHNRKMYGGKSYIDLALDLITQRQLNAQYANEPGKAQWVFTNIKRERAGLPKIEWEFSPYNPDWVGVYQHEAVCETK